MHWHYSVPSLGKTNHQAVLFLWLAYTVSHSPAAAVKPPLGSRWLISILDKWLVGDHSGFQCSSVSMHFIFVDVWQTFSRHKVAAEWKGKREPADAPLILLRQWTHGTRGGQFNCDQTGTGKKSNRPTIVCTQETVNLFFAFSSWP